MSRTNMISADYVKDNTAVDGNVDDKILNKYTRIAQQTHIQKALGTDLYNKILDDMSNDNLSGEYLILARDYVAPALAQWSLYEVLPFVSMKVNNKSITRGNSEFSTEGDLEDLKYLRSSARDLAEYYSDLIIRYIKANANSFPEYYTNSTIDKVRPSRSGFHFGIYTGNSGVDCNYGLDLPD